MLRKKDVRILLLGDPGVGKTSLLLSLVSEEFINDVPPKAEDVTIPADVTPEKVETYISDYSSKEQSEEELMTEIKKAHVICIVYLASSSLSIERVPGFWLPYIRRCLGENHSTPILLVGNKNDLTSDYQRLSEFPPQSILYLMNHFCEIETWIECSAKTLKNISEVFYYAQKAVLNPIGPLYFSDTRCLTIECKDALVRVFKICDHDNDGLLSDTELNYFQKRCFGTPLSSSSLSEVKELVQNHILDGIIDDGLSLEGFLFLHLFFIQHGHHETTWKVLRNFGYDETVKLRKDYINPQLRIPSGSTTELSSKGFRFFKTIFKKYDLDGDRCLSPSEVHDMFSTCPSPPWGYEMPNTVKVNSEGWITFEGFMAYWSLSTLISVDKTLEYLALFGYVTNQNDTQLSAIYVTPEKKLTNRRLQVMRRVLKCEIIGSQGAGKISFMQAHLGRPIDKQNDYLAKYPLSNYVVSAIDVLGKEKYLILHRPETSINAATLEKIDSFSDVVCLLYDCANMKSFNYVANIFVKYFASGKTLLPVLFVGMKSDKSFISLRPESLCAAHKISMPFPFTARGPIQKEVFVKLATMASYPYLVHPIPLANQVQSWIFAGLSITTITLISFLFLKLVHITHRKFPLINFFIPHQWKIVILDNEKGFIMKSVL